MQKKICPYVLMSLNLTHKGNMSLCPYVLKTSHTKKICPYVLMSIINYTQRIYVLLFLCLYISTKKDTPRDGMCLFLSLLSNRRLAYYFAYLVAVADDVYTSTETAEVDCVVSTGYYCTVHIVYLNSTLGTYYTVGITDTTSQLYTVKA